MRSVDLPSLWLPDPWYEAEVIGTPGQVRYRPRSRSQSVGGERRQLGPLRLDASSAEGSLCLHADRAEGEGMRARTWGQLIRHTGRVGKANWLLQGVGTQALCLPWP